MAAVVNGKLSKNTKQWEIYLLKNICTSISDGDHQAPPKSETGIPFLVISDVNKGVIDFDNVSRWVPESYYQSLKEIREGANKRGNSSRLTQSFHFFMFESIFSPVNALNQPI
ncbi:hypothetical protein [Escherichia coli]|uniref:hypothetical protein n=1 Tax=Escherichia coli TaxID=562 RepID=UPI0019552EF0